MPSALTSTTVSIKRLLTSVISSSKLVVTCKIYQMSWWITIKMTFSPPTISLLTSQIDAKKNQSFFPFTWQNFETSHSPWRFFLGTVLSHKSWQCHLNSGAFDMRHHIVCPQLCSIKWPVKEVIQQCPVSWNCINSHGVHVTPPPFCTAQIAAVLGGGLNHCTGLESWLCQGSQIITYCCTRSITWSWCS